MPDRSHCTNIMSIANVSTYPADTHLTRRYNRGMARTKPKGVCNWFIRDWMDAFGMTQAEMARRAGWSKATMSDLYNGVQDYSPRIVAAAAIALNCEPHELLMPYDRAMAYRRMARTLADAARYATAVSADAPPAPHLAKRHLTAAKK